VQLNVGLRFRKSVDDIRHEEVTAEKGRQELNNDRRLSSRAKDLIVDPVKDIEISPASYWEIAIKIAGRRLYRTGDLASFKVRLLRPTFRKLISHTLDEGSGTVHGVLKPRRVIPEGMRRLRNEHQVRLAASFSVQLCES
jgi:hypothetical protein